MERKTEARVAHESGTKRTGEISKRFTEVQNLFVLLILQYNFRDQANIFKLN